MWEGISISIIPYMSLSLSFGSYWKELPYYSSIHVCNIEKCFLQHANRYYRLKGLMPNTCSIIWPWNYEPVVKRVTPIILFKSGTCFRFSETQNPSGHCAGSSRVQRTSMCLLSPALGCSPFGFENFRINTFLWSTSAVLIFSFNVHIQMLNISMWWMISTCPLCKASWHCQG